MEEVDEAMGKRSHSQSRTTVSASFLRIRSVSSSYNIQDAECGVERPHITAATAYDTLPTPRPRKRRSGGRNCYTKEEVKMVAIYVAEREDTWGPLDTLHSKWKDFYHAVRDAATSGCCNPDNHLSTASPPLSEGMVSLISL